MRVQDWLNRNESNQEKDSLFQSREIRIGSYPQEDTPYAQNGEAESGHVSPQPEPFSLADLEE
jgi:hypothetical protein